jgi:3-oxoacid CoA-transferase
VISKIVQSVSEALSGIGDGATIMIGGFGLAGQPRELIDGLIAQGASHLTVINNNAGNGTTGLAALLRNGQVDKIVCSFPRQADSQVFDELYRAERIELELVPQGNLAERIRAGGAGIGAFYTPTGFGTILADGKETRKINGRGYVLEYPMVADFALISAHKADRLGNLTYRKTARNFGPIMASAATITVVQADEVVALGALDPDSTERNGQMFADRLTRNEVAARVAQDIPDGAYVNLGIGLPTLISNFLPVDREVILHTENGMLGMGPEAHPGHIDPDLINAGKIPVTETLGASYFHHGDSFGMMRGGHLDFCVLGALQVSQFGDLANWSTGERGAIPAVGGAMDLAIGAKNVYVMMDLTTKKGQSKLVDECSYPLTGVHCVSRIYTDPAVFDLNPAGASVSQLFGDATVDALRNLTGLDLIDGTSA